ncbi:hypothetical protein FKM82_030427 [Ascaphus truei]
MRCRTCTPAWCHIITHVRCRTCTQSHYHIIWGEQTCRMREGDRDVLLGARRPWNAAQEGVLTYLGHVFGTWQFRGQLSIEWSACCPPENPT